MIIKNKYVLYSLLLLGLSEPAMAVPSFARQTGQDCAACHIGSFGPQLTPNGLKFKLGGYTESDGKDKHVPLSAMLVQSYTQTKKDQSGPAADSFKSNSNTSLQEISVFLAGRFTENIGAFAQLTHSEPDRKTALDNVDLRIVKQMQVAGKDAIIGVSINNNPGVQDPFNTTPAWKFPYMESGLTPTPAAEQLIAGSLGQQVIGVSAYGFYDNNWYAELGGYKSLSQSLLNHINVAPGDKIEGLSPYWRLAYFKDMHKQAVHVGFFGMNARLLPRWESGPTDKYRDIGVDGSYQFLGTRKHVMAINGSYIHEHRTLDATCAGGACDRSASLNRADLSGSYHYDKTYGLTLGLFDIHGSRNTGLYASADADANPIPDGGSITNSPNSRGYTIQADWTPWGKDDSWMAPWANMRLGLQYTGYTKFNGSSQNYDGLGRNARDNNTLYSFVWFAL